MRKKYTAILIVLIIFSVIVTIIIAAWMKLAHKEYAAEALTTSFIFYVITGLAVIVWFLSNYRNKETKF